jgi:hypothetical protein
MTHFFRFSIKYLIFAVIPFLLASIVISMPLGFAENKNRLPKYVGSDACKVCHENEYKYFITYAKKSTSFKSIERVKKGLTEAEIQGCYYCHTTGYKKPGGFVSIEKTPHLKNAGCEVCHGPGESHIKTGNTKDIKRRMTIKDCEVCHISERVKAFRYKPMIHGGAH